MKLKTKASLVTALLLSVSSVAIAAPAAELSKQIRELRAAKDPNISKVYAILNQISIDGEITPAENAQLAKQIKINKQKLAEAKQAEATKKS